MFSHLDLLNSFPPSEMDDWAKSKISKIAYLKTSTTAYDIEGKDSMLLVGSIAHLIFRNFYQKLYQRTTPSLEKEIVVMTQVLTDGLGDYYNALAASESIKNSYPKQQIYMVPVFRSEKQIEGIKVPAEFDYFISRKDESCSQSVIDRIKNALFVLEIPWKVDVFTSRDLSNVRDKMMRKRKYVHVAEYGSLKHGMGLDYCDEGIFIKEPPLKNSLTCLQSEVLKDFLFEKKSICEEDVKEYFQKNEIYFSYLPSDKKIMRMFLYASTASQTNQNKNIDIISHLHPSDSEIDYPFLNELGISKIEFIYKEEDKIVKVVKETGSEGKQMRIINPFPLAQEDMHLLIFNSHMLTGCTGDQSFSEVISFNKLPFYELRRHKQLFFWHYLRLAEYELSPEENVLKEYLSEVMKNIEIGNLSEEEIKKRSILIAKLVNKPGLIEQTQKLNEIIQKKFSFNESLKGIVAQKLFQQKFPEFIRLEEKLISLVIKPEISTFQEIWDRLSQKAEELLFSKG